MSPDLQYVSFYKTSIRSSSHLKITVTISTNTTLYNKYNTNTPKEIANIVVQNVVIYLQEGKPMFDQEQTSSNS